MNKIIIYILSFVFSVCVLSSCIDEYDVEMKGNGHTVIVEGEILSNSLCVINFSRVLQSDNDDFDYKIRRITLDGSDGSSCNGYNFNGYWCLSVNKLNPDVEYSVHVFTEEDEFATLPSKPLYSDNVTSVSYSLHSNREELHIDVTTQEDGKTEKFYKWDYVEDWEVHTPYSTPFRYDPICDSIIRLDNPPKLDVGYGHHVCTSPIYASNENYDYGAIKDLKIHAIDYTDDRLQYIYRIRVRQLAISRAEYDYYKACEQYTEGMSGIFTPQPSYLPSNFRHVKHNGVAVKEGQKIDGVTKISGYIGIRGNAPTTDLYIYTSKVPYHNTHNFDMLDDDIAESLTPRTIYNMGYWPAKHSPMKTLWGPRHCFDVTDAEWGYLSLSKPSDWLK